MRMRLFMLGCLMGLTACEEKSCTMIGCMDGLTLVVVGTDGSPVSGALGTLIVDGDVDNAINFDCSTQDSGVGYTCLEDEILFEIKEGSSVEYSIEASGLASSGVLTLDFEESYPNGEDCEPVCYNDEHTIQLDAVSSEE